MSAAIADRDARRRELARIHMLAKEIGLSRAEYEDVLFVRERVRSAGALDQAGRLRVIEHLAARAGRPRPRSAPVDVGRKPSVLADRQALVDKIEALLAAAGRPWNYARAMAQRMCKVDQLEWATAEQLRKLVAALEYDRRRRAAREVC